MVGLRTRRAQRSKWFWFSFSYKGKNQGCCNVQAKSRKAALQKTIDLQIHPKHDDIQAFEMEKAELGPDRLFTKQEMLKLNYPIQEGGE